MARRQNFEERAKRIVDFYLRVDKDKKRVVKHFKEEGIPSRSVNRIVNQYEERGDASFKKIPGRTKKLVPEDAYEKVSNFFKSNPKMACGQVASQLGVSKSTVLRILRQMRRENIETYRQVETVICPTCHQRIDPTALEAIKKRKQEIKLNRQKNSRKSSTKTTVATETTSEQVTHTAELTPATTSE